MSDKRIEKEKETILAVPVSIVEVNIVQKSFA